MYCCWMERSATDIACNNLRTPLLSCSPYVYHGTEPPLITYYASNCLASAATRRLSYSWSPHQKKSFLPHTCLDRHSYSYQRNKFRVAPQNIGDVHGNNFEAEVRPSVFVATLSRQGCNLIDCSSVMCMTIR